MASPSPRRSPRLSIESIDSLTSPQPPQSSFPFPAVGSDFTRRASSTGSRYHARRVSTASSIHSVGGMLDTTYNAPARMSSVSERGERAESHGHNAISTLLQPPIVRTGMLPYTQASATGAHKMPSAKDIPPVTLPNVAHVEPSAFNGYLAQIGNLYDAFQRAKADAEAAMAQTPRPEPRKKDEFGDMVGRETPVVTPLATPLATPIMAPGAFSPAGSPAPKRRTGGSKRAPPTVTPLSTIPTVYFDENFHLENPRTFDIVSERSEVVRPVQVKGADEGKPNGTMDAPQPLGRKALATNAILQEKLSWYMDTVEVHLIASISVASSSFFAALGSLRELQSEASTSVEKIKGIRGDLGHLDQQMAVGGLKVVEMKRRRENLGRLTDATDQLQGVVVGLERCEEVVDRGELEVAMARLDTVERLILGTLDTTDPSSTSWIETRLPSHVIDLRRLRALDGVAEGMRHLKGRIGQGFQTRFLETLLNDLRQHVKSVPNQDTLRRWVNTSQRARGEHARMKSVLPAYINTSQPFRSDLRASLFGLSGSNFTSQAAAAFRDAIVREMKVLIRKYLPSSSDDDAESASSVSTRSSRYGQADKNAILARNLRAMDPGDAEQFFVNIFTDIGEALRRLSVQVKVLLDVTSGVSTPPASGGGWRSPPRSPSLNMGSIDGYLGARSPSPMQRMNVDLQEELMQALDMSSLLGQAVDAAQTQVTKLLKVRSEATTQLPLDRFLRYFGLCRLFADECEAVSGRSGVALKGVVNSHITEFVSRFGDIEKQELAKSMDSDRWEPRDFEQADVVVLNRILQGMTSDPAEWTNAGFILRELNPPASNGAAPETNGTAKEKNKNTIPAIVDEERYNISDSSTVVLRGIDRFETLLAAIPSMTVEISASLCEYLKLFNSRLCQLILGAGAMHSAGLKNINTKHLAIASQTLSFIIAILPYIRECARRHASGNKPSLAEFDNVKRLLQDQQVSIHDKLIDIMSNRATSHTKNLKKIDFDADAARDVSPNMETLTKETVTLHKVINKYLAEIQVRMIMTPVFESYREQVGRVVREADIKTKAGKERLLRDARLFDQRLGALDEVGQTGKFLVKLVEGKVVSEGETAAATEGENKSEGANGDANGNGTKEAVET